MHSWVTSDGSRDLYSPHPSETLQANLMSPAATAAAAAAFAKSSYGASSMLNGYASTQGYAEDNKKFIYSFPYNPSTYNKSYYASYKNDSLAAANDSLMGQTIASGSALGSAASGLGSGSSSPSVARPPASKGLPLSTIATAPSVPLPSSSLRHETLLRSEIHEPKKEGELGATASAAHLYYNEEMKCQIIPSDTVY